MSFKLPTHELVLAETFVAVDPAANAGVCWVELEQIEYRGSRKLIYPNAFSANARGHGRPAFGLTPTWLESKGRELDTAHVVVAQTFGPVTLLAEAQFVGVNPSSTARIITSRARWCMAFEIACAEAGRPLTIQHIPPSTWQCEYLGLPANAGSDAMKLASMLSARHVLWRLTGERSEITGDAADALCINMWALEHFLAGLPRKFRRPT